MEDRSASGLTSAPVYPYDPALPPTAYIRWLVTKNLAPGIIVILHDGVENPSRAIDALPDILAAGAGRGLRFVPVGELIRTRTPAARGTRVGTEGSIPAA